MIISPGARRLEPEVMDRPDLEESRHHDALHGLARINLWSRAAAPLFNAVTKLMHDKSLPSVRILDLASGGGDVPVRLWHMARRRALRLEIEGCDVSARAVEFARRRAERSGAKVSFFTHDVVNEGVPAGYDILTCSLYLHHLSDPNAQALLARMGRSAGHMVAVDDLRRSPMGIALAAAGTRLLTRSDVVHTDGPRSVRAAFTVEEAKELGERAGLHGCAIRPHWPFRFLLTWRKG
ncbi:MAG: methyltransferase domain-containing protein [FCB group bacterium]|jgi:2-polyprenyl-3-methyl-5-hydroxy-6-metoxy-1,4-benzoquinol methylase|nr:methyltransferase domain-containing protein [FCB group bacterium]